MECPWSGEKGEGKPRREEKGDVDRMTRL